MLLVNCGVAKVAPLVNEENMVSIKITRATTVSGVDVAPGDVVEATERDATILIAIGKAVPAEPMTRKGKK